MLKRSLGVGWFPLSCIQYWLGNTGYFPGVNGRHVGRVCAVILLVVLNSAVYALHPLQPMDT